jgi:putative flippase GtrA
MCKLKSLLRYQLVCFIGNGLASRDIHFSVLRFLVSLMEVSSVGLANRIASIFKFNVSFLGNHYFIFKSEKNTMAGQVIRLVFLYGCIVLLHGSFLFLWCEIQGLDYRVGFLIATGVQVSISYISNKFLVFSE